MDGLKKLDNINELINLREGLSIVDNNIEIDNKTIKNCHLILKKNDIEQILDKIKTKINLYNAEQQTKIEELENKYQERMSITQKENSTAIDNILKESINNFNNIFTNYTNLTQLVQDDCKKQYGVILGGLKYISNNLNKLGLSETSNYVKKISSMANSDLINDEIVKTEFDNTLDKLNLKFFNDELDEDVNNSELMDLIGQNLNSEISELDINNLPESVQNYISEIKNIDTSNKKLNKLNSQLLANFILTNNVQLENKIQNLKNDLLNQINIFDKEQFLIQQKINKISNKVKQIFDNVNVELKLTNSLIDSNINRQLTLLNQKIKNESQTLSNKLYLRYNDFTMKTKKFHENYVRFKELIIDETEKKKKNIEIDENNIIGYCWIKLGLNKKGPYLMCLVDKISVKDKIIRVVITKTDQINKIPNRDIPMIYDINFQNVCSDSNLIEN